ncbi:YdbL family protein [Desulfosarcina sp. OttesenSCG-928-A07]|nr:YdbL family protein [Desulfosarcina sp. OttesenSCG-928-A07]
MKRLSWKKWLFPVMAGIVLFAGPAFSQSIQERMQGRLPVIIKLKADGIVGETSQGFLAFVGSEKREASVVDAENNDRRQVYEAIAKKENTTSEQVGQRRALQVSQRAKPGEWLQDPSGKWYRK